MTTGQKREAERQNWQDVPKCLELCRQIRDDEAASIDARLKAVELLIKLRKISDDD